MKRQEKYAIIVKKSFVWSEAIICFVISTFFRYIQNLKLEQISSIKCFFMNDFMIIFFFVDDIMIMYDQKHVKQMNEMQVKLFERLEMHQLDEIEWFLRIRIKRNKYSRRMHRQIRKLSEGQRSRRTRRPSRTLVKWCRSSAIDDQSLDTHFSRSSLTILSDRRDRRARCSSLIHVSYSTFNRTVLRTFIISYSTLFHTLVISRISYFVDD
jgi:hypothetical protein